jgi:carbonic anhydrase
VSALPHLFANNRRYASQISQSDHSFTPTLAKQQHPEFLWIGCSDSRVRANEILSLRPVEPFVHHKVTNLVIHTNMNCLSVLQYAMEILKIKYIVVCGHYGCGGVRTAQESHPHGLIDNWLRNMRDLHQRWTAELLPLSRVYYSLFMELTQ